MTLPKRLTIVKNRAGVGDTALMVNEYHTAERLENGYRHHAVYNCGAKPQGEAIVARTK